MALDGLSLLAGTQINHSETILSLAQALRLPLSRNLEILKEAIITLPWMSMAFSWPTEQSIKPWKALASSIKTGPVQMVEWGKKPTETRVSTESPNFTIWTQITMDVTRALLRGRRGNYLGKGRRALRGSLLSTRRGRRRGWFIVLLITQSQYLLNKSQKENREPSITQWPTKIRTQL